MADEKLHPEVEALLQSVAAAHGGPEVRWANDEDLRYFALLAAEKAREVLRDSFVDVLIETDATWSVSEARAVFDAAIRRGKP